MCIRDSGGRGFESRRSPSSSLQMTIFCCGVDRARGKRGENSGLPNPLTSRSRGHVDRAVEPKLCRRPPGSTGSYPGGHRVTQSCVTGRNARRRHSLSLRMLLWGTNEFCGAVRSGVSTAARSSPGVSILPYGPDHGTRPGSHGREDAREARPSASPNDPEGDVRYVRWAAPKTALEHDHRAGTRRTTEAVMSSTVGAFVAVKGAQRDRRRTYGTACAPAVPCGVRREPQARRTPGAPRSCGRRPRCSTARSTAPL